jgi:signal transduction histidine kinase
MKQGKLLSVYTLLGIIMLAFSISMIFSFNNLRKYEKLAQSEITDATWVIYQAEIELTRFLNTLDVYMYNDNSIFSHEDVIERMEIFWSRLPLFLEGSEGRKLARIGNTQKAARAALDVLERLEPRLVALDQSDTEEYLKIRSELHGLLEPLNRTLMDARQWQEGAALIRSERLDRGYIELLLASVGILMSGGCLLLLLFYEIRVAQRAQASEKSAMARLSDAIESFSDGFSLFDKDDRLVMCNQEFRRMHPLIADKLVPGIEFEEIVRSYVDNGDFLEAIGQEQEWIKRRMRLHRTDITALKQRQEDLSSQQQRADSANKAKTDFLLTMSHELRTPLNAIMGFSEVMKQQLRGPLGDERYVDYAKDIYNSASHLLAVINNILDISRIEAGRLELDEQAVVIGDEVDRALRQLEEEARGADVKLSSEIEQDLPLLLGDAHKIQQIVLNLVGNAVSYMPDSGKVMVRAHRDQEGGILLRVEDDGAGMSAEDMERVISPFVRLSNPMVRAHDGTGLGLPLVKALVELHGGQFTLTSDVGKGTTGTATFPKSRVIQPEATLLQDGSAR